MYLDWLVLSIISKIKAQKIKVFIAILIIGLGPLQMGFKGYANQAIVLGNNFFYDLAVHTDSCPEQSILITQTDNLIFPI